ncbi:MAG TPA: hypothetical protein VHX59_04210 [Mycobacteriales bacterium]|nr:hypothetical protein [Mycobacteriales bacterium]
MTVALAAASSFVATHARMLDRHLLAVHQGLGNVDQTLAALAAYRNPDGGYGWGLEPDLRSQESQPCGAINAFEVFAEVGVVDPNAERLCDWLASVSLSDGGVPFVLPIRDTVGCAPWWVAGDSTTSSLQITAAVAAQAYRAATRDPAVARHPWLRDATQYCLAQIQAIGSAPPAHILSFALQFLGTAEASVPAARSLIPDLVRHVPADGILPVEGGAEGEVLRPLDYSPDAGTAVRESLPPETIEQDLKRLADQQQPDGGWPIGWATSSPAALLEWRGYVTVRSLVTLQRNAQAD